MFADYEYVEARIGEGVPSREFVEAVIEDASDFLKAEAKLASVDIEEIPESTLCRICGKMVCRAIDKSVGSDYAATATWSSDITATSGNIYMTKDERRQLGLPSRVQRISSVSVS